jgi:hypothetical protein
VPQKTRMIVDSSPHFPPMGRRARAISPPLQQLGVRLREPVHLAPTTKGPRPHLPRYHAAKKQVLQGIWLLVTEGAGR